MEKQILKGNLDMCQMAMRTSYMYMVVDLLQH
jgi:hypothetical protein